MIAIELNVPHIEISILISMKKKRIIIKHDIHETLSIFKTMGRKKSMKKYDPGGTRTQDPPRFPFT